MSRYVVRPGAAEVRVSAAAAAAHIAIDDEEGRVEVWDDEESRWLTGQEILLAYVSGVSENGKSY